MITMRNVAALAFVLCACRLDAMNIPLLNLAGLGITQEKPTTLNPDLEKALDEMRNNDKTYKPQSFRRSLRRSRPENMSDEEYSFIISLKEIHRNKALCLSSIENATNFLRESKIDSTQQSLYQAISMVKNMKQRLKEAEKYSPHIQTHLLLTTEKNIIDDVEKSIWTINKQLLKINLLQRRKPKAFTDIVVIHTPVE